MLDSFAQRYELCAMFHNEGLPMDRVLYKFATKPFLVIIIIVLTVFFIQSQENNLWQ